MQADLFYVTPFKLRIRVQLCVRSTGASVQQELYEARRVLRGTFSEDTAAVL